MFRAELIVTRWLGGPGNVRKLSGSGFSRPAGDPNAVVQDMLF